MGRTYGSITIVDTTDIERIYMVYKGSESNTTAPTLDWSTINTWKENITQVSGTYIWQVTVIKQSGVPITSSNWQDFYGDPTCITGPQGLQGIQGKTGVGVSSITTTYCNYGSGTPAASYGGWQPTVPTYDSSKLNYWVKTVLNYDDGTSDDPIIYKDNGITSATSTAAAANQTANQANQTANQANQTANSANQTATNAYNIATSINQHFWTIATDYAEGIPAGSYITDTAIDTFKSQKIGGNLLTRSDGIWIRNGIKTLSSLTGSALTFYNPSTNTAQLIIGANGVLQSGNYVYTSGTYSDSGTKIDLTNGSIYTPGFRTDGSNTYIRGEINALTGKIGNNSTNYWTIGNYYNYDQTASAALISHGTAFIQLDESNTWRLSTDRIHTAWNGTDGSAALVFPKDGNTYWDWGMHSPHKTNNTWKDKFIYARKYTNTSDSDFTNRDNLSNDLDDDLGYWTYQFYVDKNGSIYARNFYLLNEDGTPGSNIGGQDSVYLLKSGGTMTGSITMSNGGKFIGNLQGTADNASKVNNHTVNSDVPSGAIFTDKNVQTTQANTTKLYITGTATNGTNTGTLSYDSNVYLNTTAGDLRATTFNGYTLAAASAKGVDTSLTSSSTSTNLPTSAAVVNLIKQYLPLTGGNVTGAVSFGSSVSADELTVGDLVVNGAASFTNNLQANTINGVEVGASPKFTDTVTTVTTSGNGNAVTAITASNGKLTVTKGTTFLTSYTETDPIFVASAAHGITSSDISNWNSKTSNTGTVTSVKVEGSNGLTGSGTVTTSGTITLSHADTSSQASSSNSGRTYIQSVTLDSYGHVTGLSTATETVTDTHYTANLITGASATAKVNAAATNGNVYLNLVENNTVRNAHKITGSGTTTVTSDADGNITISSADSKTGTVTSITLTQGTGISIGSSGTAITTSGSRTISLADNYGDTKNPYASKTARYVLAAPADAAGAPSFRALTGADVGLGSVLNATQVTGIGQGADGKIRVYKGDSNYEDVAVEIVATESSSVASAQKLTSYGGSTKQPVYFPNSGTNAGKPVAIGYTIETSVPSGAVFTDTTYTFANGTNGFTVTPLNGTAQTVTVTPSIANNITGSGTSGYLAKFNGANTITSGPALGTDTTKFLNNKGEWATPSGTVTGVKGSSESAYRTGQVNITKANIGLGNVDNTADANKNVLTATKFSSSRTIALTGDVTGSASGDGSSGWSVATTVRDDSHYHTMAYTKKPIQSKIYESTSYYATSSGSWEASSWYFMSVKPDAWYKPWSIRIRVHSYCPSYSSIDSVTDSYITGRADSIAYSNYTERYDTGHYYIPYYTLKKAGFDAGLGHAIGISILYGSSYTTAAYYRTFEVDFLECENCTITFLDTPIKWANWTNGNTTNYNNIESLDAVTRGYTQSGDRNDANYQNRIYYVYKKPYADLYRYQILLSRKDGTLLPVNSVNNAPSNISKTLTTEEFDPFGEIYFYNTTTTRTTAQNLDNATLYRQILADLRYSFNITNESGKCLTGSAPVYMVAVPQSNGNAKLDSPALVQSLPSSEDGKIYIYLGQAYPETYPYRVELLMQHPVYWYKNGAVRPYISDASTVNGHTVNSDVPSNAKFTDTWNALSTSQAGYVTKAPNDTAKFLRGDATWAAVTKANVGLGNVENTALSTWTGTNKITTVGTITTGTWNGSAIPITHGGTGQTTAEKAIDALLNGLPTWTANPTDSTYFIRQDTGGSATYGKAQFSTLWNYISGKISSSGKYVTTDTAQTLTAAATKTYLGLQTYGTSGLALGVTSGTSVTQKANIKYDSTLDAIVFSFA